MSFFKSNKTNTTTTENTNTTEETTNNGGGLLTTMAIAGGTILGITAAVIGGKKLYKHFHDDDETFDSDDDFNEFEEEEDDEPAPVEDFKEVDTEEPVDETTTEAEEAKAEETTVESPVEDTVSNTEETKKPEPVEAEEAKTDVTKEEATKETETMKYERLIGEAVSKVPYDKPETVDLTFYVRCMGGYLRDINMEDAGNTGRFVIAEQCLAMTNLVSRAIIHMASANINDLDEYRGVYVDIKRLQREFKASKIMYFTQKPELCKEKFEETLNMVTQNLKLTKKILKLQEANTTTSKTSAGETQTAKNTEGETKTSADELPNETQVGNSTVVGDDGETVTLKAMVSQESIDNVNDVINIVSKIPNRENPELNDMAYFIRVIGSRIHGITEPEATFVTYDEASNSNKFIDACTDICSMTGKAICNLANSGKNPLASMQWIDGCKNELIASGIIDNTYDPNAYRSTILKAHGEAMDKLSKMVLNETQVNTTKVTESNNEIIDKINTIMGEMNPMVANDFKGLAPEKFIEKIRAIDELIGRLDKSKRSKSMINIANTNTNIAISMFCDAKCAEIDACDDRIKIVDLSADVQLIATLNLSNIVLTNTTATAINKVVNASHNRANEIASKHENQGLEKSSDENQAEESLTYTMSEKIQEAVQQSDETAATAAPEPESQAPMSPEASSLALKLQEVGALMRAEKWSDAAEFYKTQLTPYLADDGLSKELRDEIMGIKTKATNMLMSQKQLEAKQKAASAKASKKASKNRRRH